MAPVDGEIDVDPFFPEKGQTINANVAIAACFSCRVRKYCDDFKQRTGTKYGIWAGKFSQRHE